MEMEIISSLIEGGCYSAVFAILLFFALKTGAKRENCYREVICELAAGIKDLDVMDGKLDRLLELCEKINVKEKRKRPKEEVCECVTPVLSGAET